MLKFTTSYLPPAPYSIDTRMANLNDAIAAFSHAKYNRKGYAVATHKVDRNLAYQVGYNGQALEKAIRHKHPILNGLKNIAEKYFTRTKMFQIAKNIIK